MTPEIHRAMLSCQLQTAEMLLPHLTTDGLHELRAFLRHSDTAATATGALLNYRASLLEAVCARLVKAGVADAGYFIGLGDMAPAAPDSPAYLFDLFGPEA